MRRFLMMIAIGLTPVIASAADGPLPPNLRAGSAFSDDPHRQFDFWIGDWDVDLRMRQEDGSWPANVRANASIYSILKGKAILELWDSGPIKGYSLRYYDPAKEKWVLWLSWPQPNRTATSSLEGAFNHGRGDFFSENPMPDGGTRMSRFSFNDINANTLRWDDAFSSDGGATWSNNWIMEWSREAVEPVWPIPPGGAPTMHDGLRCTGAPVFAAFDGMAGDWSSEGASFTGRRILDGCAVIGFLTLEDREWFLFAQFNGPMMSWEAHWLSDDYAAPMVRYFGADDAGELTGEEGSAMFRWSAQDGELDLSLEGAFEVSLAKD